MKIEAGKFYETANGSVVLVGRFTILNNTKGTTIATVVSGGHDFKNGKRNGSGPGESYLVNESGEYQIGTDPDEVQTYLFEKMSIARKVKMPSELEAKPGNPTDTWRE